MSDENREVGETAGAGGAEGKGAEPAPPPTGSEPAGDEAGLLDIARGELNDDDLEALAQAIDAVDFATRRATPERLERLSALVARAADVLEQFRQGIRKPDPERAPLSEADRTRYHELIDQGVAAGERGDLRTAAARLEDAVRMAPDGVEGLFNLGVVYGYLAHLNVSRAEFYDDYTRDEVWVERALICYHRVIELEPDYLPALNNMATIWSMRDERDLAIEYLQRMLKVEPRDEADRATQAAARRQLEELQTI